MNRNSEGTDANVGVLQWRRGWDYLFDIPRRLLSGVVFDGREVVLGELVSGKSSQDVI